MPDIDRRSFIAQSAGLAAGVSILPSLSSAMGVLAEPMRVGVIGCGRQGRSIIAEIASLPDVTLAAICDSEPGRLSAGERRARDAKAHSDHKQMLDDPAIDAVFIATPTHLHRAVAEDAIAAGKHVYCEAPLAHSVEDAKAIAAAARGSDRVFQVGYLARANPVYQLARTFFASDAVRTLVSMQASRARKTTWRSPARDPDTERKLNWRLDPELTTGLSGEWGSHQFDVFQWYTGTYPERVSGLGSIRVHEDGRKVDDTIALSLQFPSGAVLGYDATLANSYGGTSELFRGENASIKLAWSHGWMFKESDAPTQGWEVYANRQQFHNDEGITLIAGATKLAEQGKLKEGVGLPHTPLWYGVESFLKSVTEGTDVACTAAEAARSTIVGIRAHEAVTTGTTVEIDPADLG